VSINHLWYNNSKKRNLFVLTLSAALLFTFGCNQKGRGDSYSSVGRAMNHLAYEQAAYDAESAAYPAAMPEPRMAKAMSETDGRIRGEEESPASDLDNIERKLIKRASVRIRAENLEIADASVSGLLEKHNAYAASTNIEENYRYYSLRVPAQNYDIFLVEMNIMGRLLQRYESTEDVTLRYYDLEGRLSTKKELLKTFQSYLGRAKNIEEILAVESRISELQYDIEGTGIQLRNLANQIDYSTIDLTISVPVASISNQGLTLGEKIKQLLSGFGNFLSTVVVVITGIIVYGIPVLLLIGLLFWLLFGKIGLLKKLIKRIK
jgi:hypothetical protein